MATVPATALDIFTLWSRPEIPLSMAAGDWAEYRTQELAAGRRSEGLLRIQCVAEDSRGWTVEMVPLIEDGDGALSPEPGEGWRLVIDRKLLDRTGELADHVRAVEKWSRGRPRMMDPEEWRSDPLVQASLRSEFVPGQVASAGSTVRVVAGKELDCEQLEMSAADTVLISMPRGDLEQVHSRVVTAAVNSEAPFLGIVFAAEREETRSRIVPAGRRRAPPPEIRVEIMELIGYGDDATPVLGGG